MKKKSIGGFLYYKNNKKQQQKQKQTKSTIEEGNQIPHHWYEMVDECRFCLQCILVTPMVRNGG